MSRPGNHSHALILLGTLGVGGSETKFVRLANRLSARGMPIHLAYLRPPESLLDQIDGVPTVHLHQAGKWSLRAYKNLSRYVNEHSIRSIINVNPYPLAYSVPLVGVKKSSDVINIASINTSEIRSKRDRTFMLLYARLLRKVDKLVFGSSVQMDSWVTEFQLPKCRSDVIYNGVDGQFFSSNEIPVTRSEIRVELGIPKEAFVIVCVSQFRPEKGQRNLVSAVERVQKKSGLEPFVIFVGEGAERQSVADFARARGLEGQIVFAGAASDVRTFLKASDLFVLPSTAVETFSNAALEAAAMGIPAVISDLGGAREMFPDGSTGVIYDRNSVDDLAEILVKKIRNGQPGKDVRAKVRQEVLHQFDIEVMTDNWMTAIWADRQLGSTVQ